MPQLWDEGTQVLSDLSNSMREDRARGEDWEDSPFEWMLSLPPGTKGAVGRQMIAYWAESSGFYVQARGLKLEIEGHLVAIKMSTLWEGAEFKFQQIRDEAYDFVLFVGICPQDVYAWIIPKDVILYNLRGSSGQHTGKRASETFWETVRPAAPPRWMSPYGNRLSDVRDLITDATI
ncbi:hypothetical protein ACIQG8_04535 [Pseudarthrobacter oxydans]|uniref:hypothetical protein n=1 Tax=Pseudarthrobacter oxydans TaxID=1671 RepID=UPI0038098D35